jgi:signal transduction histidine kinase
VVISMKINMNKFHLKWKIFAYLIGFCTLLLIILWLFQTVFLNSFYLSIKVNEVKSNADAIEKNIDHEDLSDLVEAVSENSDMVVEIMTLDAHDIYLSGQKKGALPYREKLDMIKKAQLDNGEHYEYTTLNAPLKPLNDNNFAGKVPPDYKQPSQSLMYVKIVESKTNGTVAVFINSVISPVNATITTLRYQLYVITAIMIILSVALAFIIAKRISKPIEEINKSAKVLAKGSYDTQFSGKGFLEICELSDTLNTAASELSKVEVLRRELMANISHDLRTPLSLIYSYAEMMHDFPSEITAEQTQTIMDETQRLSTLVNDVLDISKLEAGTHQLNITEYNLTQSIKATTERIAELIKKDGYKLSFTYDKDITVSADEVKITQVFYNLLLNAINYTGIDRTITVCQSIDGSKVRIAVTDSGEGIAKEDIPYIWDRYYKVDKRHKRAITGTGLGLSIVKKIIGLHGGEYGVESGMGNGSTFWFELMIN